MFQKIITITLVFLLGIAAANIYSNIVSAEKDLVLPANNAEGGYEYKETGYIGKLLGIGDGNIKIPEVDSPGDRVKEDQILVNNERVLLNIQGAEWATFTDTNSMDPVIDKGANAIEVKPESVDDLYVGDIVAYESEYADGLIIHRIVYKGEDENGIYFILKGDNNPASDPGKIRFEQIKRVVVAIIY
ncbi:hypothetical protein JW711_02065 [Candidatus Woesearchaeota archaeon]|nr:hypothetical protein [Candidatus Woesearchaeota archaeon]